MPHKDLEERKRYQRIYLKKYRRRIKDAGIARLAKIRDLVSRWEADLGNRKETSSRVILARKFVEEVKQILGEVKK